MRRHDHSLPTNHRGRGPLLAARLQLRSAPLRQGRLARLRTPLPECVVLSRTAPPVARKPVHGWKGMLRISSACTSTCRTQVPMVSVNDRRICTAFGMHRAAPNAEGLQRACRQHRDDPRLESRVCVREGLFCANQTCSGRQAIRPQGGIVPMARMCRYLSADGRRRRHTTAEVAAVEAQVQRLWGNSCPRKLPRKAFPFCMQRQGTARPAIRATRQTNAPGPSAQ